MNITHLWLWKPVVLAALVLNGIGPTNILVLAASGQPNKETKPTGSLQMATASRAQSGNRLPGHPDKSLSVGSVKKPSNLASGQPRRRLKGRKTHRAKAMVHANPELSYFGILERPQRYDPSLNRRQGGGFNPQIGNVVQDHFLELDKNHDGAIDPIERVTSRIDLERDL